MLPRIHASVSPSQGTAGAYGTWVVRCMVAAGALGPGDGIAVALPNTWHAWLRNSAKGVHSLDPASPNYVSARASRDDVDVRCVVPDGSTDEYEKSTREALAGPPNRCAYHTEVTLTRGTLRAGDWIDVTYGDTGGGSPGFTAALHPNGPEPVRVAVRLAADGGDYALLPEEESPLLVTKAAEPVEVVAYAPSHARVGAEAVCHVIAPGCLAECRCVRAPHVCGIGGGRPCGVPGNGDAQSGDRPVRAAVHADRAGGAAAGGDGAYGIRLALRQAQGERRGQAQHER